MTTLLFTHDACLDHDTGSGHPERAARLRAILERLGEPDFAALERRDAPEASKAAILRVHPDAHLNGVLSAIPAQGQGFIDGDTTVSPGSREAAFRAAGAVVAAVDAVVAGEATNAFCAVRPPGHHAEPGRAMGFCLFNNVAIGALHAREHHGLDRIAVVDFDVHHGNGTQAAFERDPALFFASTHQQPLYPGTGFAVETGVGNIVNAPLKPGSDGDRFRPAMEETVLPALDAFAPDFILISAGFDAHHADPLANLNFDADDYVWVTERLIEMAAQHCDGRLVSTLEGGYALDALAASAAAHVGALMAA